MANSTVEKLTPTRVKLSITVTPDDLKPSIGDTLADLPGVSATSFGPSSSRPILRGEQGERVPILVDGIGSLDLSASDPDHAVTINPLTAQRIDTAQREARAWMATQ